MARNTRRRPKQRATLAVFALILGGGGMMAANVYASATEEGAPGGGQVLPGATIDCPDVATGLTSVPQEARAEVGKELAALDAQIADAYKRLGESAEALRQDPGFADDAIAGPLEGKRSATLARIATAIDRVGDRPAGLEELAACAVRESGNAAQPDAGQAGDGNQDDGGDKPGDDGSQGEDGQEQPSETPAAEEPTEGDGTAQPEQPDVKVSTLAENAAGNQDGDKGGDDEGGRAAQAAEVPGSLPEPGSGDGTGAQAATGSLADTGARLWPAALGGVLVVFGFLVLRSVRRGA